MICPACDRTLEELRVGDVTLDVCQGGCGGIWFDRFELEKLDEPHEDMGDLLERVSGSGAAVGDDRSLACPKCDGSILHRHFFSVKKNVEVDECPTCGGFWLDVGELRDLRALYPSEEARREAARAYFEEAFGDELAEARARSEEALARARRVANMFRFICPSYYIPGKQSWGAF